MELDKRFCVTCGATFKVLTTSKQEICSAICDTRIKLGYGKKAKSLVPMSSDKKNIQTTLRQTYIDRVKGLRGVR